MNPPHIVNNLVQLLFILFKLKTGQVVSWLYFARFWLDYSRQRSQIQQYQVLQ